MNLTQPYPGFSIHKPEEIYSVIGEILNKTRVNLVKSNNRFTLVNLPCSFDIETSSFYDNFSNQLEKCAIMYEWTFGILNHIFIGRTWKEFIWFISVLSQELGLNPNKRLIVYVHNLAYEFQFMRLWFQWEKVFSIKERTPVYAITTQGIEFRCSYILSGYSLAKLAENMPEYNIKKLVGNLDYNIIHHSNTPLTEEEIAYCVNDVLIVLYYIEKKIKEDGDISKIPLTKTGYVRKYCRENCFYEQGEVHRKSLKKLRYSEMIKQLHLSPEEYKQLKRAFQGGFTHANPMYSGEVMENITSFDFTSSYPAVMVSEKFPMSRAEKINRVFRDEDMDELENILSNYCCVFDVEFINLRSKVYFDSYLSESRCFKKDNPIVNNGRIVAADCVRTTITEQDYTIIKAMYSWDRITIINLRRYIKDYLPTDFVKSILHLYEAKTTLKGVEGKEVEYLQGKEMLNSCYGMAVTDICRDEITYSGNSWGINEADVEQEIKKYNNNRGRFLFYPWGVWVTAYARRNLFTGIYHFKSDYIYADTDSIKVLNAEKHIDYIEKYNQFITNKLEQACKHHNIPINAIRPKTIKGVEKPLGVWDFDGHYKYFKTLGAKRYMVKYSSDDRNGGVKGKINITVSGLNKKACMPYLLSRYGEQGVFEAFSNQLEIPAQHTGKLTHTYIDIERRGTITDYQGNEAEYFEKSCIHLEPAEYSLNLAKEYIDYIRDVKEL